MLSAVTCICGATLQWNENQPLYINSFVSFYRQVCSYIPSAQNEHLSNVVLENIIRIKQPNTE